MLAARATDDGGMLTSRLAAHPRRTLIAVLLFVVLAGAVGGPVAGALESSGGFVAPGADSEVAVDRIEAATGREPAAGIVLLVDRPSPERLAAVERELANVPGIVVGAARRTRSRHRHAARRRGRGRGRRRRRSTRSREPTA